MTDATGCVVLASASTCNLPSPARGLPVGFGTFAFCSLCPYAARCPVPVATDDAELTPELFFHGMLMTDGCDGATGLTLGITVIDSQLILIRPPVAVLAPGCLSACTPRRLAGYSRPQ
jgi:hypothetical protein